MPKNTKHSGNDEGDYLNTVLVFSNQHFRDRAKCANETKRTNEPTNEKHKRAKPKTYFHIECTPKITLICQNENNKQKPQIKHSRFTFCIEKSKFSPFQSSSIGHWRSHCEWTYTIYVPSNRLRAGISGQYLCSVILLLVLLFSLVIVFVGAVVVVVVVPYSWSLHANSSNAND